MEFEPGFDANQQGEMRSFDPLPEGRYLAAITAGEEKLVKDKADRSYLSLTFTILEGPYKDRNLWTNLNLNNPNSETVRIAKCELGAICKAVGVPKPQSSDDLHELPLIIGVKLVRRKDTGELQNRVVGYWHKTTGTTKPAPATSGEAAGNMGQAPWKK